MKPKLVFYSDCPVFGGADMVAAQLLKSPDISAFFETAFIYRENAPFKRGASRHIPESVKKSSVVLPERLEWIEALERRGTPKPLVNAAKALFRVLDILFLPFDVLRLSAKIRALGADVVHVNNGGYPGALGCRAAALAARLAGARAVVFAVHNQTRPLTLPADAMDLILDPLVGRCVDVFVTASTRSQDSLAQRLPLAKMRIVPDGVTAPCGLRPIKDVRRELGLLDSDVAFAMTAFFEPRKGHAVLIEAARRFSGRRAPRFVLVGAGPEEEATRRAATGAGLAEAFLFLGYRDDHADILNACDALVLPSIHSEDMPLVILDAMALGKPVISTRLAGIPEEVEDGVTGILTEPGDAQGLGAALERLALDAGLCRAMGEAGRRRFSERFEASAMCRGYRALYQELCPGKPTR